MYQNQTYKIPMLPKLVFFEIVYLVWVTSWASLHYSIF